METLKPCPFCGNEPTMYQDEMTGHWAVRCVKDTHRPTLINSHGATAWCYSCTDPAEAIKAWNTRTERTCRNTLPHDWGTFECSQCGGQYSVVPVYITAGGTPNDDPDPSCVNYCPNCGAKVVSE